MATRDVRIVLPRPHSDGQREVLEWAGHGVLFAGRRWGKTEILCMRLFTRVTSEPGLYWWVGLSWRSASMKRAWGILKGYCRRTWNGVGQPAVRHIRESEKTLDFPGGGQIWMRTAERPESLAGEGLRGVVLDEFTLMQEKVWTEYIAPTLLDYGGWAFFAGVPKGLNWASRLWMQAKGRPGWAAWSFSTYANPLLRKADIDELAASLPERLRRQEIMAEVVDDSGAVFRNVAECATAAEQERAIAGHAYVMGCDWGRSNDATVFAVVDTATSELVYMDRMTGTDYESQIGRLAALAARFQPAVIQAEENSMGGPLLERLQRGGLPVVGFVTTNRSKQALIDGLVMAFERQEIRILPEEGLLDELMAYEQETMASGLIKFGAPAGLHDDRVMALALAWGAGPRVGPRTFAVSYIGANPKVYRHSYNRL